MYFPSTLRSSGRRIEDFRSRTMKRSVFAESDGYASSVCDLKA